MSDACHRNDGQGQGGADANAALSQQRAQAVVNDYGIDAKRLGAKGAAGFAPVASNGSEEGRGKNRRVEMVVQ